MSRSVLLPSNARPVAVSQICYRRGTLAGMVWPDEPADWRDLQSRVCLLFREMGCEADSDVDLELPRGSVELDVRAIDRTQQPETLYVCECKNWRRRVPKSVVHAFRTVVSEVGAHQGILISSSGFQSGAIEAAHNTNIRLLSWTEFQDTFYDRWVAAMMLKLKRRSEPIFDYLNVLDDRIAAALNTGDAARMHYYGLFKRYACYAYTNQYTCMVQGDPQFPIEVPDPRRSDGGRTTFSDPREFFDVLLEWAAYAEMAFENYLELHLKANRSEQAHQGPMDAMDRAGQQHNED